MELNKTQVLIWLKEFKHTWLPDKISKDTHLLQLIIHKLSELEKLLKCDIQQENTNQLTNWNENGQIPISPTEPIECSLFAALEKLNDRYEKPENTVTRPIIRIKRIPLAEAQSYIPAAWKPNTSKRGRRSKRKVSTRFSRKKKTKRNIQTNSTDQVVIATSKTKEKTSRSINLIQLPSTSSLTSTQSNGEGKKQSKRKLRAIDAEDDDLCTLANLSYKDNQNGDIHCDPIPRYIGQNGILSQTRKNNETTTMFDSDFSVKSKVHDSTLVETITLVEDNAPTLATSVLQQATENSDNESLFSSLNLTHDRTFATNSSLSNNNNMNHSNIMYNDGIEDISNDGIDPPPSRSLATMNLSHFSLLT